MARETDLERFINGEVDVENILKRLDFVDEGVVDAALSQPSLFVTAARYRVQKMRRRLQLETNMDLKRSRLAVRFRNRRADDNTRKRAMTEGMVREALDINEDVIALRRKLDIAFSEEEFSKLLLEAYKYRERAINVLVNTQRAESTEEIRALAKLNTQKEIRERAERLREKFASNERIRRKHKKKG